MSRRIGRWTYYSHPYNGPVWRLDGTTLDLEHDLSSHACCNGGDRCNGAWVLYEHGRYREPISEHLCGYWGAMWQVERRWDGLILGCVTLLAIRGLIVQRWIKRNPGLSNADVAKRANVSEKTVTRARKPVSRTSGAKP